MIIPVHDLGKIGIVSDQPADTLPLNAWTGGRNVRFREGAAEKFLGHTEIFSGPVAPPKWLLQANQDGIAYWLYASDTKVGATSGASHADISRDGSPYISSSSGWNGTIIEGIPVITNGSDVPQMWRFPSLLQKLQDLVWWPSNYRCKFIYSHKRYLCALDITKDGTRFPTMIKWSDEAPTGGVPLSWDPSDQTRDAGEATLPGEGGFLISGVPLRDDVVLYREHQTWLQQYVGGVEVFRFRKLFDTIGSIARHGALEFFSGRHLVYTGDDIVQHDGSQAHSLLTERYRKELTSTLDMSNYGISFFAIDHGEHEAWFCYPEVGQSYCSRALVWNWNTNRWGSRELPNVAYAVSGIVSQSNPGDTWNGSSGSWDSDNVAWRDRTSDPTKRRLLMAIPGDALQSTSWKFVTPGVTNQFAGSNIIAMLERQGIGFPLKQDRPPDYTRMKQVLSIFPRVTGTANGKLQFSLGLQDVVGGPLTYHTTREFTIGSSFMVDFSDVPASRIHALKIESDSNIDWKLHGYDADVIDRGMHG